MAEEFELFPHKIFEELKYDVEALKNKLSEPDLKANELMVEIEDLKESIHELNNVFKVALEETKGEDSKELATIKEKLDAVVRQNETIAQGMVAISEKVEEFTKPKVMASPQPNPQSPPPRPSFSPSFPPPPPGSPSRVAPPISMPGEGPLPPPPEKKRSLGLFH